MTITIYCGDSLETWTPKNIDQGIGGSEEAVINISKQLATRGHTVKVYNRCEDDAGTYDGVEYIDYTDYEPGPVDVAIGWRNENVWKLLKGFRVSYHWLHDTIEENRVRVAQALGAQKVMVLSKYHRRLYPKLRNEEVFLTRNGIDPSQFEQIVERVPGRVFYGSSYDRGLKELLEEWPKIKLAIPEATLHIAYGWQTWDKIAASRSPEQRFAFDSVKAEMTSLMEQEGVTHLGRISHMDVAKEMLKADIWGYPTWWPEISCITAMKAQAAGAIPIVIPTAAVAETVQAGYRTNRGYYQDIQGNPATRPSEALDEWVDAACRYLSLDEAEKAPTRSAMESWARDYFDWKRVAEEWEREFEMALVARRMEPKEKLVGRHR